MSTRRKNTLSVAESATLLGRSTKSVRRYIKQGVLPCDRVNGKFGPEIRIPRRGLDTLLRKMSTLSRPEEESLEILRLYRKASPDIRELVKKILTSTPEEQASDTRGGFLRPFFRKKGGEKP